MATKTKTLTLNKRELELLWQWATSANHSGYESDHEGNELLKKLHSAAHALYVDEVNEDEVNEAEERDARDAHRMPTTGQFPNTVGEALPTDHILSTPGGPVFAPREKS